MLVRVYWLVLVNKYNILTNDHIGFLGLIIENEIIIQLAWFPMRSMICCENLTHQSSQCVELFTGDIMTKLLNNYFLELPN